MTPSTLEWENERYGHTGGVSCNCRHVGLCSAFRDSDTGHVYLSRFADGSPAPIHLLDGLPEEVVRARDARGRITAVKHTVVAGFLLRGCFYTRDQAARLLAGIGGPGEAAGGVSFNAASIMA